jgi:hypothetical protein
MCTVHALPCTDVSLSVISDSSQSTTQGDSAGLAHGVKLYKWTRNSCSEKAHPPLTGRSAVPAGSRRQAACHSRQVEIFWPCKEQGRQRQLPGWGSDDSIDCWNEQKRRVCSPQLLICSKQHSAQWYQLSVTSTTVLLREGRDGCLFGIFLCSSPWLTGFGHAMCCASLVVHT